MTTRPFRPSWRAALLPLVCGALLSVASAWAQAPAAPTLRPEVQKPLLAAQQAYTAKQYEQAFKLSSEALAVPQLTPYERVTAHRSRAAAANALQNWDATVQSLEEVVGSERLSDSDRLNLLEALINASLQKKDYPRVVKWARQYIVQGGDKPVFRTVLVQSLSLLGEHRQVVEEMQKKLESDAQARLKTAEQELRLMAVAYQKLKDEAGYLQTLKRLLALYPAKPYWEDAVGRLANQSGFNARLELDLYRLLEDTGNLEDADIRVEMVTQALKAGLPAEARRVIEAGFADGSLGQGGAAAAHQKLRADVQKKAQEDERALPQLEKSAQDGNDWAGLGEVRLSRQDWAGAHEAFAKALALGGVRREHELRLHDGLALLRAGQKDAARQQFERVQGDASAKDVAALWLLRLQQP